jgi:uncharacterized membrane protein YbhN (UPF0104 family)
VKLVRRIASILVVGIIFYFLLKNLITNWHHIPFDNLHFNGLYLVISFGFLFLNFFIFVEGWRSIVSAFGSRISFKKAFWIMSSSQLAKYVPGGIWFALGRVYLGRNEKIKEEIVAISVVVETGLTFVVGILLFAICFMLTGNRGIIHLSFLIPALVVFLVVLYPPVLNTLMRIALRLFKRDPFDLKISYVRILGLSIFFIALWLSQIIGFYFLINAVYSIPFSSIFTLGAAYTLSWMTGFVVIFAPGGLGVREGMMTLLLASLIPSPLAVAISFIARVWMTLFEIVVFFIGLLIRGTRRITTESQKTDLLD